MIYLDANIFIYAYWKPRRKDLAERLMWKKAESKKIIESLNNENENEIYCTSLIQIVEIVNILKVALSWNDLQQLIWGLFSNPRLEIIETSKNEYMNAVSKISEYSADSNDIAAYRIMKEKGIESIYTFDEQFKKFEDINCLPEIPFEFG
ncbi:MAG TPA: type II toxin-antitoxin system VapC family toxin [Candidatus Lokiarchaeia archaeon]|nr:type II toxin-antitoxin system VapC family toxin [Candidatus Lokiarchaeia archaeon]